MFQGQVTEKRARARADPHRPSDRCDAVGFDGEPYDRIRFVLVEVAVRPTDGGERDEYVAAEPRGSVAGVVKVGGDAEAL